MPFKSDLEGKFLGLGQWSLTKQLKYETLSGDLVTVPEKFVSDGASIPRFWWRLIGSPWGGKYGRAAVLHDFLCESEIVSRKRADIIFREAMKELGVPAWRRNLMYFAVRAASHFQWC